MAKVLLITDKKLCLENCFAQKHNVIHIDDALEEINSKKYHILSPDTKHTYIRDYCQKYDFIVIDDTNWKFLEIVKSNTDSNKRKIITLDMYEYLHTIKTPLFNFETRWQEMGEKLYNLIENEYINQKDYESENMTQNFI